MPTTTHNRCFKLFGLMVAPPLADMPLDRAIYHSALGGIVGVRGGYIFKFDATTGSVLMAKRFANSCFQYGCVAYGVNTGKLYATVWNEPLVHTGLNRLLFTISPATLTVDSSYDLSAIMASVYRGPGDGPGNLIALNVGGVDRLAISNVENNGATHELFLINPVTHAFNVANLANDAGWVGLCEGVDAGQTLWVTNRGDRKAYEYTMAMALWSWTATLAIGFLDQMSDVTYPGTGTYVYLTTNTQYLFPCPIDASPVGATIDLGAGATTTPNPYHVRWNGVAIGSGAKLYVPGYKSDAIHIVDLEAHTPAQTSDVTVKTGFDCPIDVVFAGTKAWAVQHGVAPLKEIV